MVSTNSIVIHEDEDKQYISSNTQDIENHSFMCSFCKKEFKFEEEYDTHVDEEHQGILKDDKEALKRTSELTAALNAFNENPDILKPSEVKEEEIKTQIEMKTRHEKKVFEDEEVKSKKPANKNETIKDNEQIKCDECDTYIETKRDLRMHKKNKHEQLISCNQCLVKTRTKEELKTHKQKTHYIDIKCEKCQFKAKDAAILKVHMMRKHLKLEMFQCDECPKKFPSRMVLVLHKKKHIPAFKCDHCNFKGISIKNLQVHQLQNHIPNSFSNIGSKRDHTMVPKNNSINGNSPPKKFKKIEKQERNKIKENFLLPKSTKDVIGGETWSYKKTKMITSRN